MVEIVVCGSPRSGNSWLTRLLSDALDSPVQNIPTETPEYWGSTGGNYVIRRKHTLERPPDCKCVFISRDPRDVAVSLMYYRKFSSLAETLQLLATRWDPNVDLYGPYENYVRTWWQTGKADVETEYEFLHIDGVYELQYLVGKLTGEFLSEEKALLACKRQSFQAMRERNPNRDLHAMRKGIAGDWRNHFKRSDGELCQQYFGQLMIDQGYITDPEWWKELPE